MEHAGAFYTTIISEYALAVIALNISHLGSNFLSLVYNYSTEPWQNLSRLACNLKCHGGHIVNSALICMNPYKNILLLIYGSEIVYEFIVMKSFLNSWSYLCQ